jgi:DNA-binding NarL/FixJ family response regulator
MTSHPQTRVGIVALDPLRLAGLETILDESIGLAARAVRVDEAIAARDLAAVLLDSSCLPDLLEVLARFRRERPQVKVVVLGGHADPDRIQAMLAAGAKGYLPETAAEPEIRLAMQAVLDGSVWAPRKVLARLIEAGGVTFALGERAATLGDLFAAQMTYRERDVMRLLMDGRSNRQIAEAMGIELVTVKAHLGRMLRKAGVKNRVELTLKAMQAEGWDRENDGKANG